MFIQKESRFQAESVIWQDLQKMSNILCNCNCPLKNRLPMFMTVLSLLLINVKAQAQDNATHTMPELPQPVRPSKGVVIAVLSMLFATTILLLAYVKFCRITPLEVLNQNSNFQNLHGPTRSGSRFSSGIDRQVIETLPFFKFSSLKGSKEGLECTVCLSKFEDTEILRLLPKCKHAFHMNCIDKWLESHSTCPLCRCRVDPADIKNLAFSISSRFLRVPSNLTEDPNVEIFVQRESSHRGSSRRTVTKKEELLLDQEGNSSGTNWKPVHEFNHRIVISDVVSRSRWSDLNSSDLLSLSTEMLNDMSSSRFSSHLESTAIEKVHGTSTSLLPSTSNEDENSFTSLIPAEKRSMSEIARVPRFAETLISKQNRNRESVEFSGNDRMEERLWRIWLPIARRTVQWFAREERNSRELEDKPLATNV